MDQENLHFGIIPSDFSTILLYSVNPFCHVSIRNNEIYMNILNRAKYRMVLNNDCLLTEYDMETEFNGTMIMNISYDYVQDHFTDLANPVKVYQNKIVKIGSEEAKALYPSIPMEIEE